MQKIVAPTYQSDGFTCPHCEAYAHQEWYTVFGRGTQGTQSFEEVAFAQCSRCNETSVWVNERLVDPAASPAPMANLDMPEDIKVDYQEARSIAARSPRGAAALLRLCIQKLCVNLGQAGKDLNADIGALVKKGLLPEVQQMLDAVRVIGNNAVHPGEIDLKDTSGGCFAIQLGQRDHSTDDYPPEASGGTLRFLTARSP